MPTWIEKFKIANRHKTYPTNFWVPLIVGLVAIGFALQPAPSFHELRHYSGTITSILHPRKGPPVRLLVQTGDGQTLFMLDGPRGGPPAARALGVGDAVELWSYKDGKFQHIWQLAKNGELLIPYDRSARAYRGGHVGLGIMGLVCLAVAVAIVEYLYRRQASRPCAATVCLVDVFGQECPPYYHSRCDCGWAGTTHEREGPARAEALAHTPHVDDQLEHTT